MFFSAGSFPSAPQLATTKALLLLDLQNDFIEPYGKLLVDNTSEFVPRLPNLISKFRESGEVIWIQTHFVGPRPTVSPQLGSYTIVLKAFVEPDETSDPTDQVACTTSSAPQGSTDDAHDPGTDDPEAFLAPRQAELDPVRCCLPKTIGSHICQALIAAVDHEKDTVLLKSHYSAFANPTFLQTLRKKLVTELYLCGSLSNISVYATALDAVRHGFGITIIEDCVGYRDEKCHTEAMRQMADGMGANGVDCQELLDDLNGDLGDVVTDDTFKTRFEVALPGPPGVSDGPRLRPRVQEWMELLDKSPPESVDELIDQHLDRSLDQNLARVTSGDTVAGSTPPYKPSEQSGSHVLERDAPSTMSSDVPIQAESPQATRQSLRETTPSSLSPPRKRSTGDLDLEEQESKADRASRQRRMSHDTSAAREAKAKASRIRVRRKPPRSDVSSANSPGVSTKTVASESDAIYEMKRQPKPPSIGTSGYVQTERQLKEEDESQLVTGRSHLSSKEVGFGLEAVERVDSSTESSELASTIGEGDSRLIRSLLPLDDAAQAFHTLRSEVHWQKMFHRSGEVPRLVAVQGRVSACGFVPVYRHPADESPPLAPFSSVVESLRQRVEKVLHHPINHVLIQLYRSGEDNISEHSDKTLDIIRGSDIANLSLGAHRTMTLRTKRSFTSRAPLSSTSTKQPNTLSRSGGNISNPVKNAESVPDRKTQRVALPHNSLFVLGQKTNQYWLHAIRADKRRELEKSAEERDFQGERISLTFRHIGTFISPIEKTIWGQGATSKLQRGANKILTGAEAEKMGERMIQAFGQENHQSHEFNWHKQYGDGFDVVNFTTKVAAPAA